MSKNIMQDYYSSYYSPITNKTEKERRLEMFKLKSSKEKEQTETVQDTTQEKGQEVVQETNNPEEEWYWVEGYKGTSVKMCCKNNFQYELGKAYTMSEEHIKICESGFHFCKELRNVFNYYPDGRYFKVKALISKKEYLKYKDLDKYKKIYYRDYGDVTAQNLFNMMKLDTSKFVAKSIILTEELPYNQFESYISHEFVHSAADYEEFLNTPNYVEVKFASAASELGYSPTFIQVVLKEMRNHKRTTYYEDMIEYMQGLCEMKLTTDMNVYLLLDKIKSIKN